MGPAGMRFPGQPQTGAVLLVSNLNEQVGPSPVSSTTNTTHAGRHDSCHSLHPNTINSSHQYTVQINTNNQHKIIRPNDKCNLPSYNDMGLAPLSMMLHAVVVSFIQVCYLHCCFFVVECAGLCTIINIHSYCFVGISAVMVFCPCLLMFNKSLISIVSVLTYCSCQ